MIRPFPPDADYDVKDDGEIFQFEFWNINNQSAVTAPFLSTFGVGLQQSIFLVIDYFSILAIILAIIG